MHSLHSVCVRCGLLLTKFHLFFVPWMCCCEPHSANCVQSSAVLHVDVCMIHVDVCVIHVDVCMIHVGVFMVHAGVCMSICPPVFAVCSSVTGPVHVQLLSSSAPSRHHPSLHSCCRCECSTDGFQCQVMLSVNKICDRWDA